MAKQTIQAPIDKPLARSYLREFSGWSTAYPPGMSDPTSLRTMENIYVTREGAARIRPGTRSVFTANWWLGNTGENIVGSFEHFVYDATGRVALLFAVRGTSGTVSFRVVVYNEATNRYDDQPGVFNPMTFGADTTFVKYLQIDNKILALSDDPDEGAILFFVGETKSAKKVSVSGLTHTIGVQNPTVVHPDAAWINTATKITRPAGETPTTGVNGTLISSTAADNTHSFGFFVTYETEFGESMATEVIVVKAQRGWSQWKFNVPDASGNSTTTIATDPERAMDQLVILLNTSRYAALKAVGMIKWNAYMFAWNDTSPVPSVATLVATRDITTAGTEATESWAICTAAPPSESYIVPTPNDDNRANYSGAPRNRNGIAAGDRLILVNDGENQARINWSSNIPGEYTNFSPSKGGGRKTLSSGNLLVPINVQLWQNPQSVDTLSILCKGLNGQHAAYYMAPASVSGQSDSTVIMGFEETTATPGTVSPYGVEVLNNALYHPLGAELMKSTAQNYNISHKTMTTDIANKWQALALKDNIISSQFDGRLYYIVNNPDGEPLEDDCMGNEVWVLDVAGDAPVWSRWLVQGISLKKLQIGDKLYMAIIRPDAIFIFDEMSYQDEYAVGAGTERKNISWKLETNTLGANRQHDMYALLYQANVHVGDFIGSMEWGIKGVDVNGMTVDLHKRTHAQQDDTGIVLTNGIVSGGVDLGDAMDYRMVQRDMMEWTFYAHSVEDVLPGGSVPETWMSFGQLDYVQFMLMQQSANIGTERGSVESFEYRRNAYRGIESGTQITRNGIPMPMDMARP
jgi:hypothetical protein